MIKLIFTAFISVIIWQNCKAGYTAGQKGGCPSIVAFFNLAPVSPCYGTRCSRAQCQADCDRTSACAGYEFDAYDQGIEGQGYCFMLSKSCPVPLNRIGEDYRTRWSYMKTRLSFTDDVPITFRTINDHRVYQAGGSTGPISFKPSFSQKSQKAQWRSRKSKAWERKAFSKNNPYIFDGKLFNGVTDVTTQKPKPTAQVLELPDFVSIHGGCPTQNAFLPMAPNFVCHGRRCHKIDCATACLSSSLCIGFEFDAWDQSSLSSHGYCWLLRATCSAKLSAEGEDFMSRWTYLRRWDEKQALANAGEAQSMVINIGTVKGVESENGKPTPMVAKLMPGSTPPDLGIVLTGKQDKEPENSFLPLQKSKEGRFFVPKKVIKAALKGKSLVPESTGEIDMTISNQPLVPKMQFVHGWNLQQSYMMSVGGCTSSPGGGTLVYLPMEPIPEPAEPSANSTTTSKVPNKKPSVNQCLFHQCTRFDCENTCNHRSECVGYEFAGVSHGLTTIGYCHLLKRPCPADQRSEGAVFLTRLTYLKAE